MNLRISLYIFSLDFETKEYSLLLIDDVVPNLIATSNMVNNPINDLIARIFGVDTSWIDLHLCDLIPENQSDTNLVAIYSCLLPGSLDPTLGKWEEIGHIKDETTKQFILQVLQKTIY